MCLGNGFLIQSTQSENGEATSRLIKLLNNIFYWSRGIDRLRYDCLAHLDYYIIFLIEVIFWFI